MFNLRIHPQPLHDKQPGLLLDRQRLPLGRSFLKEPVLDFPSQKAAPARQPEKDEIELAAWEQLDRDVEEACVVGAEGQSFECEAVLWDMV
jgi:hypothetical protein